MAFPGGKEKQKRKEIIESKDIFIRVFFCRKSKIQREFKSLGPLRRKVICLFLSKFVRNEALVSCTWGSAVQLNTNPATLADFGSVNC